MRHAAGLSVLIALVLTGCSAPQSESAPARATGPVKVGVLINKDLEEQAAAAGAAFDQGDTRRQAQAVIDDINARGGFAGRRVEPVYQLFEDSSEEDQYNLACTAFTQDSKVEAVINSFVGADPALVECLAKAGTPLIGSGGLLLNAEDYAKHPGFFYSPVSINATRLAPQWIDLLRGAEYFGTAPRIGVIHDGTPNSERALDSVRSALEKAGLTVTAKAAATGPEQAENLVLQFKDEDVDHVMFMTSGAGMFFYFAQAAEQQKYRPRYAVTSYNTPAVAQEYVPPKQLSGAIGMGWAPLGDVDGSHQPPLTEATRHCRDLMVRAGQDMANGVTAAAAMGYCDTGFFLKALADRADGVITADSLSSAAGSLGREFEAAAAMGTYFAPDRYDGAGIARTLRWGGSCKCFEYVGPERPLD